MLKDIVIIGAGGVGRETVLIIEDINEMNKEWNLLGFVDDNDDIQNKDINGYEVLGKLESLKTYAKEVYVVCAIANYKIKKNIIERLKENKNIKFATLIHPSTKLNKTVKIGEGCIVYQNVIATANISIGDHVIISPKSGIGHDTNVENYCSLLWNVNISGNVLLKEGVLVGSGATIIQGIEVGKESIIGAEAVVIRDIPSNKTAVGNPTRII
jgi:sugar O-acyltransferase (sialic acid O-acetyltransferase NeuD family)